MTFFGDSLIPLRDPWPAQRLELEAQWHHPRLGDDRLRLGHEPAELDRRRARQDFKASTYVSDLGSSPVNATYSSDALGRLTGSGTLLGPTLGWNYDLAGNRSTNGETETGVTATSYTANSVDEYSAITGGRAEPGITYERTSQANQSLANGTAVVNDFTANVTCQALWGELEKNPAARCSTRSPKVARSATTRPRGAQISKNHRR